jgi:hypothetical protein
VSGIRGRLRELSGVKMKIKNSRIKIKGFETLKMLDFQTKNIRIVSKKKKEDKK